MIKKSSRRMHHSIVAVGVIFLANVSSCSPGAMDTNQGGDQASATLDAAELVIPDGGDALIIITEDEGLGSVVYFGIDNGVTVKPTSLVADAGEDQLSIVFDAEGRPAQITFGPLVVDFSFKPDGSFDASFSDGNAVLFTDTSIEPTNTKVTSPLRQRLSEIELFACETGTLVSFAEKQLGALDDNILSCLTVPRSATSFLARYHCFLTNVFELRLREVQEKCLLQPDPDACFRRVEPFLTGLANILEGIDALLVIRINKVNNDFPPCTNEAIKDDDAVNDEDDDMDRVKGLKDLCPNTPEAVRNMVNVFGCSTSDLGVIDCEDTVILGEDCLLDGCCQEGCIPIDDESGLSFDPDCTNAVICDQADLFCCDRDDVCDAACPELDLDCTLCELSGQCIQGCVPPDPDCMGTLPDACVAPLPNPSPSARFVRLTNPVGDPPLDLLLEYLFRDPIFPVTVTVRPAAGGCPAFLTCPEIVKTFNDIDELIIKGVGECGNPPPLTQAVEIMYELTVVDACGLPSAVSTARYFCCDPVAGFCPQ